MSSFLSFSTLSYEDDPKVLVQYVLALLKKNQSERILRQNCVKQLELFLDKETNSFVDSLFDVIKRAGMNNLLWSSEDRDIDRSANQQPIEDAVNTDELPSSEVVSTAPETLLPPIPPGIAIEQMNTD